MKQLKDEVDLTGKLETISATEFRQCPGEVFKSVSLGKTFLIEMNGTPLAVLQRLPGQTLTIVFKKDGSQSYAL